MKETAITICHETGRVRVDTTSRKVATRLKRQGFAPYRGEPLGSYSSWVGIDGQISFRKPPRKTGRVPPSAFKRASKR